MGDARRLTRLVVLAASAVALVACGSSSPTDAADTQPASNSRDVAKPPKPVKRVVRYVSPAGSDANPGTLRQPWRTLRKAITTLGPGGTAYLRAGVYEEGADVPCSNDFNRINWERSGTPSAPITIAGYPGEQKQVIVKTQLTMRGSYLRLIGLVVEGNRSFSSADKSCTGSINVTVYGDGIQVVGVEIRGSRMSGIYAKGADSLKILRCWIHDNGSHGNQDHGAYIGETTSLLIANSVFDHNQAFGIHVYPSQTHGARILHNTVVENGSSGVIISGNSSGNVVANNIIAFNKEYAAREFKLDGGNNRLVRNLIFGNGLGQFRFPNGRIAVSDSIEADPLFVDSANRDFRLRPESPALTMAVPELSRPTDYLGAPRPQGPGPDLGAFER
jgi:Right handed beta helix region